VLRYLSNCPPSMGYVDCTQRPEAYPYWAVLDAFAFRLYDVAPLCWSSSPCPYHPIIFHQWPLPPRARPFTPGYWTLCSWRRG
jgi:hypothetical protein